MPLHCVRPTQIKQFEKNTNERSKKNEMALHANFRQFREFRRLCCRFVSKSCSNLVRRWWRAKSEMKKRRCREKSANYFNFWWTTSNIRCLSFNRTVRSDLLSGKYQCMWGKISAVLCLRKKKSMSRCWQIQFASFIKISRLFFGFFVVKLRNSFCVCRLVFFVFFT